MLITQIPPVNCLVDRVNRDASQMTDEGGAESDMFNKELERRFPRNIRSEVESSSTYRIRRLRASLTKRVLTHGVRHTARRMQIFAFCPP